ncbi:MAG: hypothetical protein WBC44_00305 [Planctomycetaceae bacterium]
MAVDEIIEQLETLPPEELRRIKSAVEARLSGPTMTEEEFERRLVAEGRLTLPDRSILLPAPEDEPPLDIEGEPLSEQLIRERR